MKPKQQDHELLLPKLDSIPPPGAGAGDVNAAPTRVEDAPYGLLQALEKNPVIAKSPDRSAVVARTPLASPPMGVRSPFAVSPSPQAPHAPPPPPSSPSRVELDDLAAAASAVVSPHHQPAHQASRPPPLPVRRTPPGFPAPILPTLPTPPPMMAVALPPPPTPSPAPPPVIMVEQQQQQQSSTAPLPPLPPPMFEAAPPVMHVSPLPQRQSQQRAAIPFEPGRVKERPLSRNNRKIEVLIAVGSFLAVAVPALLYLFLLRR